jgi:hypothetical protein
MEERQNRVCLSELKKLVEGLFNILIDLSTATGHVAHLCHLAYPTNTE